MSLSAFQVNVVTIGAVTFLVLAESSALFVYVWDSTHGITVPMGVTQFITMGLTFVISALSHQQGSKSSELSVQQGIDSQVKTGILK